jgi:hypothetical protein
MLFTLILSIWIYFTPQFKNKQNDYPLNYFLFYSIINCLYAIVFSAMALTKTAFFTQVSDKKIGGTYMTLYNTLANIGSKERFQKNKL